MAEVWKATAKGSAGFAKTVAIKRILPGLAKDREFIDRFIAEARVAAALVHPNIVQVFDFGELEPGVYFLAMEYVPGVDAYSLARWAFEKGLGSEATGAGLVPTDEEGTGALPPQIAIHLCMETARGLGYAHSRKPAIVHRDVSPQNILISFDGEVKLADFGIAKVSGSNTSASVIKGKLSYMSPEQVKGEPVDGRADLFSLGVTLYRMLTARPLFVGETLGERLAALTSYRGISEQALSLVPKDVRPVLDKALKPNPRDRYADAAEMEAALGEALGTAATVSIRRALAGYVRECEPEAWKTEQRESSRALTDKATGASRLSRPSEPALPAKSRAPLWIGIGAVAVALAGGVALGPTLLGEGSALTTPTPVAVVTPAPTTSPATQAPTRTETPAVVVPTTAVASAAASPTARPIVRDVASYEVSFLEGCTDAELVLADTAIRGAIKRGVALFNKGDTAGCFDVYRATALEVRDSLPDTCSGPRAALAQGIARAERLATPGEKAYAIRDAFDGLLDVVTRRRQPG